MGLVLIERVVNLRRTYSIVESDKKLEELRDCIEKAVTQNFKDKYDKENKWEIRAYLCHPSDDSPPVVDEALDSLEGVNLLPKITVSMYLKL